LNRQDAKSAKEDHKKFTRMEILIAFYWSSLVLLAVQSDGNFGVSAVQGS
jgi:hypothetical protein